jgi:hypothetical protein
MNALLLTSPITVEKVAPVASLLADHGFDVLISTRNPTAGQIKVWITRATASRSIARSRR